MRFLIDEEAGATVSCPNGDWQRRRSYPRRQLAEILGRYQQQIGHQGSAVNKSLERLAEPNTLCVVTGQQVGLATGPFYTVLKAISVVRLAQRWGMVPIFWVASEDHDVAEVAATTVLGAGGDLHRHKARLPAGHFVESLPWLAEYRELLVRIGVPSTVIDSATRGAVRYAEVMVRLLAYLFRDTGLLFVEPYLLRPLAGPFFEREIRRNAELQSVLQRSEGPLRFADGHTNLFYKGEGNRRLKITQTGNEFVLGDQQVTADTLADKALEQPEYFSTGVAARPVLQSTLIPTAAYVAGPHERTYLSQLSRYHQAHDVPEPQLIPRLSATFIPAEASEWLDYIGLQPWEVAFDPKGVMVQRELALAVGLPPKRLHYLRNLLFPLHKPQERTLNWWQFEAQQPDLVQILLAELPDDLGQHLFVELSSIAASGRLLAQSTSPP